MKKWDIDYLNQLALSLEEAEIKLRQDYYLNDIKSFNSTKKLILQIQKKMEEILQHG